MYKLFGIGDKVVTGTGDGYYGIVKQFDPGNEYDVLVHWWWLAGGSRYHFAFEEWHQHSTLRKIDHEAALRENDRLERLMGRHTP